jgi:ABC-type transport system involved in multi-copper enzyme maturation permease subunit
VPRWFSDAGRFSADVWWVAYYELGEAVRTRLFQLVLVAYTGGIAAATWVLVQILVQFESAVAAPLGVPTTDRPGAMMSVLLENGKLADLLGPLLGRDTDVAALLHEPILGLWTGAMSMLFLPLVLLFSASGSVAAEVKSRSVRFLSCRTGRLEIGLGKLAGQLLLGLVAAGIGGAVAWGMGMTLMVGNPPLDLAVSIALRTSRAAVWALPFAGLGLAASQWFASPNGARVVAAGLVMAMPLAGWFLRVNSDPSFLGRVADLARQFIATTVWAGYWSTDPATLLATAGRSVVLAVLYFSAGYAVFARRDL